MFATTAIGTLEVAAPEGEIWEDEIPAVLRRLTPEQRAAARWDRGHLLIVAGAGTGKTTTLAARIAHLVDTGADPSRLLLLTFSRRAAAELLQRAEQASGRAVVRQAWGGTFHSVANRLLRRHGPALGLDPSFTVLDQRDAADLLALVREENAAAAQAEGGPPPPKRSRRAKPDLAASILSRVVNSRTPLSAVLTKHYPWCVDQRDDLRAAFAGYTERKRAHQLLDFDDLLLCWHALLQVPAVAADLGGRFDHVLVDEYQDTNALQAEIVLGMLGQGARLTAVGDDAQAIYGFRAATVRNILDLPDLVGAEVLRLEQSHRSTPQLLAFTNAVAAEATERHEKTLWTARPDAAAPTLVTCADEGAQSAAVCERILDHFDRGTPLRAQAVLVRTGHHSDLLELELTVRNIPFVKYGGLTFLEAAHVKDLLAACRLAENPRDEVAWFRLLQLIEGIGPATARRIIVHAGLDHAGPPDHVVARLRAEPPPLASRAGEALAGLADALVDVGSSAMAAVTPAEKVARLRRWLDPLVAARHGDADARLADLDQLTAAAGAAPTLERFLVDLALDPPVSTGDLAGPPHLDDDWITISTIHSAKGLEWDVVHVIHAADGNIPSDMATGNAEEIEEERRLLYVALTRARDHAHVYFPLRYHIRKRAHDDLHSYAQLSRFLTPAVLEHVEHAGAAAALPEPCTSVGAGAGALAAVDASLAALWD
jgi:DNA helicase-2/ATP-dependent DNA helicase PcrA